MQKDFIEAKDDNPIINLLEKHDAFDLINDQTSPLYPQIWGICEFEREGIGYIGRYENPEKQIDIRYQTYQTPQKEDVLTCEATTILDNWTNWQEKFPEDFINALIQISPLSDISPETKATFFQQFTFKENRIETYRALYTKIHKGDKTITLFKMNRRPTTTDISRQAKTHLI